jgi:hypothetical protein
VAEIYIGFPKGDYARPEGRKGRVIKDDPTKYPAKDDLGPFLGATGALLLSLFSLRQLTGCRSYSWDPKNILCGAACHVSFLALSFSFLALLGGTHQLLACLAACQLPLFLRPNPVSLNRAALLYALLVTAGGWAGGEAGLWQLREQVMREKAAAKSGAKPAEPAAAAAARPATPPAPKDGKQPIYVGYAKE